MSSKSKAPKSAPKAKKAKPTLEQMLLKLEVSQETLTKGLRDVESKVANLQDFAARVEAKVFPPDPTPEDWQRATQVEYSRRLENWRKQFRDWVENLLAAGGVLPPGIPVEYFEKAFGPDWRTQVAAFQTPKNFFGYQQQPPRYPWTGSEEEQHAANQQRQQQQARARVRRASRNPGARAVLNAKVQQYAIETGMPFSDAWHQLYDALAPLLGYDARLEAEPDELPLDVLDRKEDLQFARRIVWTLLERATGRV